METQVSANPAVTTTPSPAQGKKKSLKTVIIVVILFLAGIASVLGISRVRTYLGGAQASDAPKNVQVQASDSSATVSWQTEKAVLGTVMYGANQSNLLLRAPESQPVTIHRVTLSPLKADTVYFYRIQVGETIYDNGGAAFSFRTKPGTAVPTTAPIVPTTAPTIAPTTTPSGSCDLVKVCTQSEFESEMGGSDCSYDFDDNGIVNTRDWIECLRVNR